MNTKVRETSFTEQEIEETRAKVVAILGSEDITQRAISDEAGIAYGTFTSWLGKTYAGHNDKIAEKVEIWLASRTEKKLALSRVPQAPSFQATPTAQRIMDALAFAQIMPDIAIIAGGAGIGKTTAAEEYQGKHPNVWMTTMDPSTSSASAMMRELCETLAIQEKSATELARAIGRKVQGKNGLLLIDEAQHLSTGAIEQLRSFHDKFQVGVALLGNESVYDRLGGESAKPSFAQIRSRFGDRLTQPKPRANDICMLIKAWGVTEKDEVKLLKAIASKPGALRGLTKCLQRASIIAAGAGEARDIRHIRAAFQRLEGAE